MDFEFSEKECEFLREVDQFLKENHDPKVMDVTRENMAQVCDTPDRRAFMKKVAEKGWLGITWPKEYGGQEGEGFKIAMFSLENGEGVRFLVRSRLFTDEEFAALSAAGRV